MQKVVQTLVDENAYQHCFFDFGTNAFGTLTVEMDCDFEENIEIIVGEAVAPGGDRVEHTIDYRTFIQQILQTGIGHQVIQFNIPKFIPAYGCNPYCSCPPGSDTEIAPFRYVEINRHYGKITVHRTAWYVDGWDDAESDFTCDNAALKKVWDFCKYSIKAESVFDKYVDGERERMPYEADMLINQLGHFCNSCGNFLTARNTIDYFFEYAKFTWPTEWRLQTPRLIYDYMMYSNDTESLKRWLPMLESKLMLNYRDENGLLNQQVYKTKFPGENIRDIIDHPETERDGYEIGAVNLVPNAFLYDALKIMNKLTGDEKYLTIAAEVKAAIRKHLMIDGIFVDSIGSRHTGLHAAMIALLFDLCDTPQEIAAHKALVLAKNMDCSVYGSQLLIEACYKHNMADHALKLLTSDAQRSWLNMLREGATTAAESWSLALKGNIDWTHAWGAAPANLVTRELAGIKPIEPGFKKFSVDPQPASLKYFTVKQPTIHGTIELNWLENAKTLTVPQGTEAVYNNKVYTAGTHTL